MVADEILPHILRHLGNHHSMEANIVTREVKPEWNHKLLKHENCERVYCNICEGGLALCIICNGAEGTLPLHCPGSAMSEALQDCIMHGVTDYRFGEWVTPVDFSEGEP